MLRSDLCGYSDAYIVVEGTIIVEGTNDANKRNRKLTFKNNVPFRSCISKINNTLIDNAEDLDITIPIHNLLEYSDNYSITSDSLWNQYWHEINNSANENNDANNYRTNNNKTATSKFFQYKTKVIGRTPNDNNILDAKVVVPLKYLSNFWRSLDLPLVNCEMELDLSWWKYCIIPEISRTAAVAENPNANPPAPAVAATATTSTTFQINNAKLYVSVFALSINDNVKF